MECYCRLLHQFMYRKANLSLAKTRANLFVEQNQSFLFSFFLPYLFLISSFFKLIAVVASFPSASRLMSAACTRESNSWLFQTLSRHLGSCSSVQLTELKWLQKSFLESGKFLCLCQALQKVIKKINGLRMDSGMTFYQE